MKKIIAVTVWDSNDALIKVYTLPYINLILKLYPDVSYYVQTFEKSSNTASTSYSEKINLIKSRFTKSKPGKIWEYIKTVIRLTILATKKEVIGIHAFCTPGAMIGYVVSKISGKPLIIDSLEPQAECMVETGTWEKNSLYFKVLFYFEKLSTRHARSTICVTPTMHEYVKSKYGIVLKNYYYKPACIDIEAFQLPGNMRASMRSSHHLSNEIVCVYAGKFGDLYLEEEVFDFFAVCYHYWNKKFKVLLLTGQSDEYIHSKAKKAGLPLEGIIKKFVAPDDVPKFMHMADFGISSIKPIPSRKYCTPIKTGEYWASGLPVVITKNISIDSDIIEKNKIGYVLQELNKAEYHRACEAISYLLSQPGLNKKIIQIARQARTFALAETAYRGAFKSFGLTPINEPVITT